MVPFIVVWLHAQLAVIFMFLGKFLFFFHGYGKDTNFIHNNGILDSTQHRCAAYFEVLGSINIQTHFHGSFNFDPQVFFGKRLLTFLLILVLWPAPSLYGIFPYAGLKFYFYEEMKSNVPEEHKKDIMVNLVCGSVAGLLGQTITYPLDVVRRQMQVYIN